MVFLNRDMLNKKALLAALPSLACSKSFFNMTIFKYLKYRNDNAFMIWIHKTFDFARVHELMFFRLIVTSKSIEYPCYFLNTTCCPFVVESGYSNFLNIERIYIALFLMNLYETYLKLFYLNVQFYVLYSMCSEYTTR